jgi:cell wall-associated NlpC family hydrolase
VEQAHYEEEAAGKDDGMKVSNAEETNYAQNKVNVAKELHIAKKPPKVKAVGLAKLTVDGAYKGSLVTLDLIGKAANKASVYSSMIENEDVAGLMTASLLLNYRIRKNVVKKSAKGIYKLAKADVKLYAKGRNIKNQTELARIASSYQSIESRKVLRVQNSDIAVIERRLKVRNHAQSMLHQKESNRTLHVSSSQRGVADNMATEIEKMKTHDKVDRKNKVTSKNDVDKLKKNKKKNRKKNKRGSTADIKIKALSNALINTERDDGKSGIGDLVRQIAAFRGRELVSAAMKYILSGIASLLLPLLGVITPILVIIAAIAMFASSIFSFFDKDVTTDAATMDNYISYVLDSYYNSFDDNISEALSSDTNNRTVYVAGNEETNNYNEVISVYFAMMSSYEDGSPEIGDVEEKNGNIINPFLIVDTDTEKKTLKKVFDKFNQYTVVNKVTNPETVTVTKNSNIGTFSVGQHVCDFSHGKSNDIMNACVVKESSHIPIGSTIKINNVMYYVAAYQTTYTEDISICNDSKLNSNFKSGTQYTVELASDEYTYQKPGVSYKEIQISRYSASDVLSSFQLSAEQKKSFDTCISAFSSTSTNPGSSAAVHDIIANLANGSVGANVASYALSQVGTPYSMDNRSAVDENGKHTYFDCSSLAYYSWASVGVYLTGDAAGSVAPTCIPTAAGEAQWLDSNGYLIWKSGENAFDITKLQAGDLIYYSFENNGRYMNIGHAAIYCGNGKVCDAAYSKKQVMYRDIYCTGNIVLAGRPPAH